MNGAALELLTRREWQSDASGILDTVKFEPRS
jgi:hypothetical protein